ncbi:hypothetical protein ACFS27_04980 [Promicromonospora vindobonensis]|uniref:DUF3040 family protein n=1 Tax=Promicromonospora vindobonensis TaxID=195748 RepID=A0ABW5VPL5_9MICO
MSYLLTDAPPLPDEAVRLVRLSRVMTRAAVGALLVALGTLVLASLATSRYLEATMLFLALGHVLLAVNPARRRTA